MKDADGIREITLAVVGAHNAGKSTFVQCALDLKRPSNAPLASKKVSLEGVISILRLLEIPLEDFGASAEQDLTWPKTVGGHDTSAIDGALVLCDVMDQDSLSRLPNVLSKCFNLSYKLVLEISSRVWSSAAKLGAQLKSASGAYIFGEANKKFDT